MMKRTGTERLGQMIKLPVIEHNTPIRTLKTYINGKKLTENENTY